jgi:hypothetical protein
VDEHFSKLDLHLYFVNIIFTSRPTSPELDPNFKLKLNLLNSALKATNILSLKVSGWLRYLLSRVVVKL